MVDPRIADRFRAYLRAGERVSWTGTPASGLRLRGADLYLIPFSALWLGFAIFWEASVVGMGGPAEMVLSEPFS